METNQNKELIISLIRDNLINTKLVLGLSNLGLIANGYYLNLGDTIFKLIGFDSCPQSDLLFETVFVRHSEKVCQIDITSSADELTLLSTEIYTELLFAKEICNIQPEDKA